MLSVDKHCEILDTNIRDKIATIYASFRLFIQLYSAIVGGVFYFHLQLGTASTPFGWLANVLVGVVAVTCVIMIVTAQYSWYRFRETLSSVAPAVPKPGSLAQSSATVITMIFAIMVAVALFLSFNPLAPLICGR